jgi:enoyl-CoA hydratase/carnithine racemase
MPEGEPEVITERRGAVTVIRINRPEKRNALNGAVMAGIGKAIAEADAGVDVRAIVLTGTGDRSFCAGMDLAAFSGGGLGGGGDDAQYMGTFMNFMSKGECKTPVIGAAQATALAGGFELLLSCDIVVASEDAQFGIPEVKRGLFAAGGGMFLSRRIPLAKALELALTGAPIDANEAARLGLINKVVPADKVVDEAVAIAELVAANGPLGVEASKKLLRMAAVEPAADVWKLHSELQGKVFSSKDAQEGSLAFVEKRSPVWKGE